MRIHVSAARRTAAVLAALMMIAGATSVRAAGPSMMPGFPLRAGSNVMLMWMPFPGAASYNVYRAEKAGGPYEKVGSTPANTLMDANIPMDKAVYYTVKALIDGKEGDASAEVTLSGIEPMKTPAFSGFLITQDGKVALRWENNPKAAFYNLFRSDAEKGEYKLLTSIQDTKHTDTNVTSGKTYYYKVTAVSSGNIESPKAEKPYVVKAEKVVVVEEKQYTLIRKDVSEENTYDVDGNMVLRSPKDVALDGRGNLFVADGRGFIHYVSGEFKLLRTIGEAPAGFKGTWGFAEGIFFDQKAGLLYCVYPANNQIRVFDLEGKMSGIFSLDKPDPKSAPKLDWAPYPVDIIVGGDGNLWVTDAAYFQIVVLGKDGKEIRRISLPRENPGRKPDDGNLISPSMLAINPKTGKVYVLEVALQRVTVLDKEGKFAGRMGGRGAMPGKMLLPAGVAVDEDGTVYVGDRNQAQMQSFSEKGEYLATFVNPKKKDADRQLGIFPGIVGVAVSNGMIYYTDVLGERVVAYKIIK